MDKTSSLKRKNALVILCAITLILLALPCWSRNAFADSSDSPIVVSIGDSYSSGEGNEPFYGQDNKKTKYNNEDWLAHRSHLAWPGLLTFEGTPTSDGKGNRNHNWYFVASSGATTKDVIGTENNTYAGQTKKWSKNIFTSGSKTLPLQKNVFADNHLQGNVDYITMSIGGNDVDFAGVVTAAALDFKYARVGGLTNKVSDKISLFRSSTQGEMLKVYKDMRDQGGSETQILVAGYPRLLNPRGGGLFNKDEATLINLAVDYFDEATARIILTSCDEKTHFLDVRDSFDGHEAYTKNSFINKVKFGSQKQELVWFTAASAYSMHPNKKGHRAYAKAVQKVINGLKTSNTSDDANGPVSDVSISIVMDVSGSMGDNSAYNSMTKLESAKRQSNDFVNSSVKTQGGAGGLSARVGLCSFSSDAYINCDLSSDPDSISSAIDALQPLERTNLYDGLELGIKQLDGQSGTKMLMLLSDGLSNEGPSDSEILQLAQTAKDKDITIYTIGYGSSYDLDEDLLRGIADATGGSYSHEDPSNASAAAVGLFASMMDAQLRQTQEVLLSQTSSVQQGETKQVGTYDVSSYGTLTCYLYWPGSVLNLQLTDPDGVTVEDGYAGYAIDTSSIPTVVTIEGAKTGEWQMSVYGQEVSMENEPFYAVAAHAKQEKPAVTSAGGGGSTDSGFLWLFLASVALVGGLVIVYATSVRRKAS